MPLRTGRFRRVDRLRRSAQFQAITKRGRRLAGTGFVILVAERAAASGEGQGSRLGVTVSRKVGGAVVRNRVKRRIREWFRVNRESLGPGRDWVVIGRSAAAGLGREAAEEELTRLGQLVIHGRARGDAA